MIIFISLLEFIYLSDSVSENIVNASNSDEIRKNELLQKSFQENFLWLQEFMRLPIADEIPFIKHSVNNYLDLVRDYYYIDPVTDEDKNKYTKINHFFINMILYCEWMFRFDDDNEQNYIKANKRRYDDSNDGTGTSCIPSKRKN